MMPRTYLKGSTTEAVTNPSLLETGIEDARDQVPPVVASLEETEGGVLMRGTADDLAWTARLLAGLSCPFAVRRPQELGDALGRHAA